MTIPSMLLVSALVVGGVLLLGVLAYLSTRFYHARQDFTYMTHDERDFKRTLSGWGFILAPLESVVKGAEASPIDYPTFEHATGKPTVRHLRNLKTGAVDLRPKWCAPPPFQAVTKDNHTLRIEARIMFSLNRDLLRFVYQLDHFGDALVLAIQDALRAEIGQRYDEELRAQRGAIEAEVLARLRKSESDGDEAGELGMSIGVNYHRVSFTAVEVDPAEVGVSPFGGAVASAVAAAGGETPAPTAVATSRALAALRGATAFRPQELDTLGDVFKDRSHESTQALLALLDMQTRQNIAEALASSGQLVIVTAQELGLAGSAVQLDAMKRAISPPSPPSE